MRQGTSCSTGPRGGFSMEDEVTGSLSPGPGLLGAGRKHWQGTEFKDGLRLHLFSASVTRIP